MSKKTAAALLQVSAASSQVKKHHHAGAAKHQALPPSVLWHMIRPNPWNCDLLHPADPRAITCRMGPDTEALKPELLACGDFCNDEHVNSYRTLQQIGALPCCSKSPFCTAPACSSEAKFEQKRTCTPRSPKDNVAYMKQPDAWPAYHGRGGSFELDIYKFLDLLACRSDDTSCKQRPFDLLFDLGANHGYYTEKLTLRNFAKNYVMVEANPVTTQILNSRWSNATWKETWFTQQVPKTSDKNPDFEVVNQALSNHSKGELDMCVTEPSMALPGAACKVPIKSVDSFIPKKLTQKFQDNFLEAQSAFVKVDTEGMDELVLRGMQSLLETQRGEYENGEPRYLVNFLQLEYTPLLMQAAKDREGFTDYDLKTVTRFLEKIGFESFLIGPRFLPLSHGSWDDEYKTFLEDARNNAGKRITYPDFDESTCGEWCKDIEGPSITADIFAVRSSHPRATELKVKLGACQESKDFDVKDSQYVIEDKDVY